MNVLSSTWALKYKLFPDGLIKKFKARFYARGDQKIEGVDHFETYSPVVIWITIRLMLFFEYLLYLKSKQGDVKCALLHAHFSEDETLYVHMPLGFTYYLKKGKTMVLKLKRCLYCLKQFHGNFGSSWLKNLSFVM